jgi:nitrate/nitrite-specific signal transduction histidine kinase
VRYASTFPGLRIPGGAAHAVGLFILRSVRLARANGEVLVTIPDDGAGFDSARRGAGVLGLVMMRERSTQLNAYF